MNRINSALANGLRAWHLLLAREDQRWCLRSAKAAPQPPWLAAFVEPTDERLLDTLALEWLDTIVEVVITSSHAYWVHRSPSARHMIWRTRLDDDDIEESSREEFLLAKEDAIRSLASHQSQSMVSLDFRRCEFEVSQPFSRTAASEPFDVRLVVLVSVHGWFAQQDVLGRPDTGGQVIFVREQARALAEALPDARVVILTRQILDAEGTSCDQPLEKLAEVDNGFLVRVPFTNHQGDMVRPWISRYEVWPYLDRFASHGAERLASEFDQPPDLVIGHAADGNWVAMKLSQQFDCPHLACAHWLEKPKYRREHQDWNPFLDARRIPTQFLGELIAYHHADAIIASSGHEIRGTREIAGPWESYDLLTVPPSYRVTYGMNTTSDRFTIVPPGVDERVFYPSTSGQLTPPPISTALASMFAANPGRGQRGVIADPSRPWIVALARLDPTKNISGLVKIFATSSDLRATCNLLVVTSACHIEEASEGEERAEITRIEQLVREHHLHDGFRWCGTRLSRTDTGELYRQVAARHGCLAQPALMEHFGLTVIEAMACGLPTVVTSLGGPAEIVGEGAWGEVADPRETSAFAEAILRLMTDRQRWHQCADDGLEQVRLRYRWCHHAREIVRVASLLRAASPNRTTNRSVRDAFLNDMVRWFATQGRGAWQ